MATSGTVAAVMIFVAMDKACAIADPPMVIMAACKSIVSANQQASHFRLNTKQTRNANEP